MNYSQYVPQRCINTTNKSIQIFKQIMDNHNFKYKKSTDYEDYKLHIDYYITLKNKTYSIDIKSNKMLMENDTQNPDYWWTWVEIKNVKGENGWLLGKADLIGFVFVNEIWMLKREELKNFFDNKVQNIITENKNNAKYKLYSRKDRKDLISRLNLLDIENNCKIYKLKLNGN